MLVPNLSSSLTSWKSRFFDTLLTSLAAFEASSATSRQFIWLSMSAAKASLGLAVLLFNAGSMMSTLTPAIPVLMARRFDKLVSIVLAFLTLEKVFIGGRVLAGLAILLLIEDVGDVTEAVAVKGTVAIVVVAVVTCCS